MYIKNIYIYIAEFRLFLETTHGRLFSLCLEGPCSERRSQMHRHGVTCHNNTDYKNKIFKTSPETNPWPTYVSNAIVMNLEMRMKSARMHGQGGWLTSWTCGPWCFQGSTRDSHLHHQSAWSNSSPSHGLEAWDHLDPSDSGARSSRTNAPDGTSWPAHHSSDLPLRTCHWQSGYHPTLPETWRLWGGSLRTSQGAGQGDDDLPGLHRPCVAWSRRTWLLKSSQNQSHDHWEHQTFHGILISHTIQQLTRGRAQLGGGILWQRHASVHNEEIAKRWRGIYLAGQLIWLHRKTCLLTKHAQTAITHRLHYL